MTFSADRKTLIKYPNGRTDVEYVIPEGTEVIGKRAFWWSPDLQRISIPTSLNEIGDDAFVGCVSLSTIVWGTYPEVVGDDIFGNFSDHIPVSEFVLSEANVDCTLVNGLLFSVDKKTLHLVPPAIVLDPREYTIPEGTEIIGKSAFYGVNIEQVTLPSSLKSIEDYAFWSDAKIPTCCGSPSFSLWRVVCNAITPPTITRESFFDPSYIHIFVPEEAFDNYASSPEWKRFGSINGVNVSIANVSDNKTGVKVEGQILQVTGDNVILKLDIFTLNGLKVLEKTVSSRSFSFDLGESIHGVFLLEICYKDGTKEVFKLLNE